MKKFREIRKIENIVSQNEAHCPDDDDEEEMDEASYVASDGDIEALESFYNSCQFLGILTSDYNSWSSWKSKTNDIDENLINKLIEKRNEARNAKDFTEADRIRDELLNMDVILEDRDNKTTWKLK